MWPSWTAADEDLLPLALKSKLGDLPFLPRVHQNICLFLSKLLICTSPLLFLPLWIVYHNRLSWPSRELPVWVIFLLITSPLCPSHQNYQRKNLVTELPLTNSG